MNRTINCARMRLKKIRNPVSFQGEDESRDLAFDCCYNGDITGEWSLRHMRTNKFTKIFHSIDELRNLLKPRILCIEEILLLCYNEDITSEWFQRRMFTNIRTNKFRLLLFILAESFFEFVWISSFIIVSIKRISERDCPIARIKPVFSILSRRKNKETRTKSFFGDEIGEDSLRLCKQIATSNFGT